MWTVGSFCLPLNNVNNDVVWLLIFITLNLYIPKIHLIQTYANMTLKCFINYAYMTYGSKQKNGML